MEQLDSSVEESSKVSEQQQRNDEQQCPNCAAELTEASVYVCMYVFISGMKPIVMKIDNA